MSKKIFAIFLVMFVIIFTAEAYTADKTGFPVQYEDELGHKIILEKEPERIISLAPSITELIYFLGLEDKLVGVTTYANYPPEAAEKEKIGSVTEVNIEKIITLEPDLIIADSINKSEALKRLNNLGLAAVGFNPLDIEETIDMIKTIGWLTGSSKKAEQIAEKMNFRLKKIESLIAEKLQNTKRPDVFYEIWSDPLYTAGDNTFINSVIETAGGNNIGKNAEGAWPRFGIESLILADPDVYISSPHSAAGGITIKDILNRPLFSELKAVKKERVYLVDQDKISRPSPRIIDGLKEIAAAIFPELKDKLEGI
ncbi:MULTISPECIES: ABC transporter substrate-binding protein [unclassified Halanaerobium]|uniref:ABC transporter substrate-binding protein n=1 Tax=unclassified Halanaerobium TaxID=2641197 RepID=UPI000DF17961|nr:MULTISPECIES: cobalamin-binding protein [unclassified Halanaerobium]RCW45028.1 iron complex transport system substrate-binding protein [Halanaerobium sp. MA284_MarDTE_T2]RCW83309.1 iron complex transport system substrate-binding protein [Halanaerobium sp. DL-01]